MKNLFIFALMLSFALFFSGCQSKSANSNTSALNNSVANAQPTLDPNSPPANQTAPPVSTDAECSKGTFEPEKTISSPTEAYTYLFEAVKAKNTDKIKQISSQGSRQLADFMAGTYKKPCEEVYKNGFTETTFNEKMPETRDLQIKGNFATLEVKKVNDTWEVVPFIKEGSNWKIASGEMFFGKFTSPGKPKSIREAEVANMKSGNKMIPYANSNTATNSKTTAK